MLSARVLYRFVQKPQKFVFFHPTKLCLNNHNYPKYASSSILTKETDTTSNQSNSTESERQFLVRLKNDPDLFGEPPPPPTQLQTDESDLVEEEYLENQPLPSQKLRTKQYADIIKSLIRKRKIKEAIDVVEVRMIKEDRVKPENYIFNLLLGACGRVGYTKKAFSIYNQMKKRSLKITGGTYTALFNACANSPWPSDGLTRAHHLRNLMIEKMYEPNDSNYNAMIKAFGRCGDLSTAFKICDEMLTKGIPVKDDTINFLLQACVSDKDAGFRHALLVWRKLIDKNIKPSIYTFNLLLKNIRDCGIGDVEVTKDVLEKIIGKKSQLLFDETKLLESKDCNENSTNTADSLQIRENNEVALQTVENHLDGDKWRPNLLAKQPHLGNIVSLSEITRPEDRLLLVGGYRGFLQTMDDYKCKPDIKTFTQLLHCLPGNVESEKQLLAAMKKLNVTPDIDFFNMLIKKRSIRFDYVNAKEVLKDLVKYQYRPDLVTYGVLALGCKTREQALELIEEMKLHSYRLNVEILGAMLRQACYHMNFKYILEIMEIAKREDVKPSKKFMEYLEEFKKKCKHISNDKDDKLYHDKKFQKGQKIFQMHYKAWKEEIEMDPTQDEHPWKQYRQNTETDVGRYKDKDVRFKARHNSKFKANTSTKRAKN